MKLYHLSLATAAAALVSAPLLAGSPVVTPAPEPVVVMAPAPSDWTGAYVGIMAGYTDLEASDPNNPVLLAFEGMTYGAQAGYLYDFGKIVAGVELAYFTFEDQITFDSTSIKARIGLDAGRFMPYLTGGAAYAYGNNEGDWGYAVGVGVDFALTEQVILGAEYLYSSFEDFNGSNDDYIANTGVVRLSYHF